MCFYISEILVVFIDSLVPVNSRRDRHWHLGQGAIGLAGLRHLFSHPWFKPEAAIMETPKPHQAYEWYNLLVARSLAPGTLLLAAGEACPGSPSRVGQAF